MTPNNQNKTSPSDKKISAKETQKTPAKKSGQIKTDKSSPVLITTGVICILASISAISLSLYNLNQTHQNQTSVSKLVNDNTGQLQQKIEHQQQNFKNQLQTQQQQFAQMKSEQQQELSRIDQALTKMSIQKIGDDRSWQLKRVAYLVELAQTSLHWQKVTSPAVSLLVSADNIIKNLHDARYTKLRQSLNHDISSLKNTPKIDTTGLLSQVSAMAQQIPALPIKMPQSQAKTSAQDASPQVEKSKWKQAIDTSLAALSKIVVIRRNVENYQPLISKEEKRLLVAQAQLDLRQAQWALINQNLKIYRFSLQQVQQLLSSQFDTDNQSTRATLEALAKLSEIDIAPKLPTIEDSYQQLMELTAAQNKISTKGESA